MSAWKQTVDDRLGELRTDIRSLLIGGAFVALALFGGGWAVYNHANDQMQTMAVQQQSISGKIDTLDTKVSGKLDLIGQRLDDQSQESSRRR